MRRAALAIIALIPLELLSQTTATITGTVSDPSGSPVSSARVSARAQSGLLGIAETDDAGTYSISNLPLQPYFVSVERQGFQVAEHTVVLRSNVAEPIDFRLALAEQATALTVG